MAVVSCIWNEIAASGNIPCSRFGHSITLVGDVIIIFGGSRTADDQKLFEYFNDLYQATVKNNCIEWEKLSVNGMLPQPRDCHSACVLDDRLYVFGGKNEFSDGKCLTEVFYFDLKNLSWIEVHSVGPPPSAVGYTACAVGRKVFTFGGILEGRPVQDTFLYNVDTSEWTPIKCSGAIPPPRCDHGCVLVDETIYLFGGSSGPDQYHNDLYSFETDTFTWTKVKYKGLAPSARAGHSFVAHRDKDIYVYGGCGNEEENNLIYKYSIGRKKWKQPLASGVAPPVNSLHGHCSIILHSTMFVIGGIGVRGEMEMDRVFTLKLINPSIRKPVIEHMLNDLCQQSNSLSCWLPTTKPNVSYRTTNPEKNIESIMKTTLIDSLPLNTKLVKEEFLESEDLESQRSLLIAARAELAKAKQLFENDKMELIRLLERERKEAQYMIDRHRKQNEEWWKTTILENDAERTKLRQAWEKIEVEKAQLNNERHKLKKKAQKVAHLLQQLT